MTKKTLNQNAKFVQKLEDTIEPDFVFGNKPFNRFKIINRNEDNLIQNKNKTEKLLELKKQMVEQ